jgi:hypothetical protein
MPVHRFFIIGLTVLLAFALVKLQDLPGPLFPKTPRQFRSPKDVAVGVRRTALPAGHLRADHFRLRGFRADIVCVVVLSDAVHQVIDPLAHSVVSDRLQRLFRRYCLLLSPAARVKLLSLLLGDAARRGPTALRRAGKVRRISRLCLRKRAVFAAS